MRPPNPTCRNAARFAWTARNLRSTLSFRYGAAAAVALILGGCGGGGGGGQGNTPAVAGCSTDEQVQYVFDLMNDIYYWIDDVPAVSNSGFASPEAVIEAFRFAPLDRFSGLRDREENDAFFSASQFIGLGVGLQTLDDNRVRITQVFSDGPAAAAGLARGDEIVAINGRDVSDILAAGEFIGDAFGADEVGVVVTLAYRDVLGSDLQVTLSKALVTIETVSLASVIDHGGQTVGYLLFRNFVEPSFDALEQAFAQFSAAGVDALVLDLRYNSGGLIAVAEYLAGLIGGTVTDGEIFTERVHNSNNEFRNLTTTFNDETDALDLDRVVIITSLATASASELVINGLRPFADVTLVGEQTFGKPVGSYQYSFCDKVAVPIAFANINAAGSSDYYDGFTPDCEAADDLDTALGDPAEASLAEALQVLTTGSCSAPAVATGQSKAAATMAQRRAAIRARPEMRQLINAF